MTARQLLDEMADELEADIVVADGFDDALIGTTDILHRTHAVYDRDQCIQVLIDRDGMEPEEATEFFEYNVAGAYIEGGPIFIQLLKPSQL